MHDIKFIRTTPDAFDAGLARRGLAPAGGHLVKLDEEKRRLLTEIQNWQSEKNKMAKEIGMAKAKGDQALFDELMLKQNLSASGVQQHEDNLQRIDASLRDFLSGLPNIPADDVPEGKDEKANKEVRAWGKKPEFSFKPKEHFDLGEALGQMDFEAAAKISGARFVVLKGALARMERALASFFLDNNIAAGYTEFVPPFMVKSAAAYGTGQLPKFGGDLFRAYCNAIDVEELIEKTGIYSPASIEKIRKARPDFDVEKAKSDLLKELNAEFNPDFWLVPTAEVPLTNLVGDSILDEETLPLRMTAYTPCFRSEAGAAGKDTRGMIRQHQFSKVELVSITHPDKSKEEHERMTAQAESLLQKLGLAYRTMLLCTGDMGFCSEKTYDIEVWLPGQNTYREISSCSNCGAFQARRMKARFKAKGAKDTQFVHTLNGSGLPIGRTLVAILENYQNADGSIAIPEALRPYMGGLEKISK